MNNKITHFTAEILGRTFYFPTIDKILRNNPTLTITSVYTDKRKRKFWIEDEEGIMHEGIEVNEN